MSDTEFGPQRIAIIHVTGGVVIGGSVYGAIQSGSGSFADMNLIADGADANALREAIHSFRESLASECPHDLPEYAHAVLSGFEDEAAKAQPERKRLASLYTVSAGIIEVLANVPAAWEAVRMAAGAVGIGLL